VRAVAVALLVVAVGSAATAGAAPVIDVQARTRVGIDTVTRTGSGVRVRGTLVDASTGDGLAGREVIVLVDGEPASGVTDRSGRFDVGAPAAATRVQVAARFDGDADFGESAFEARAYDATRAALNLELRVPESVDAAATGVEAQVTATSEDGPEQVRVTLRAGDGSGPGALRAVGEAQTGADGTARVELPRDRLGLPGDKRLFARFDGSPALNPAQAEARFVLVTATHFSDLELPPATVRYEKDIVAAGKLLDTEGKPVAGTVVTLARDGEAAAEEVTDARGRFALHVEAADHGPGPVTFTLEHTSTVPWRRGAVSSPFAVEIAPPRPVPPWVSFAAFGGTALAVLLYVLVRTEPWRLATSWLRARRRRPESAPERPLAAEEEAPAPGLKAARPGLMSTLRRAQDHQLSGRVRDLVRGVAVGGARLRLTLGDTVHELVADGDGHFEIELAPGHWSVVVSAHGYVTETVNAPVPHRGELRGARIDLLPVRERVFALYREVAAPLLPRPELWGVWTPREILDHLRGARATGAFGALTDLVEEAYFAERVPDESVVAEAAQVAIAARVELR
jgi:hypothetical protein